MICRLSVISEQIAGAGDICICITLQCCRRNTQHQQSNIPHVGTLTYTASAPRLADVKMQTVKRRSC